MARQLPAKMPRDKALEIENINLRSAMLKSNTEAELARMQSRLNEIAKEYVIGPNDTISTETGEIRRSNGDRKDGK
jgi:hypothetical protein